MKTYPDIDPETLGAHYEKHIVAMTVERLDSKADIAAQLALRDQEIERLQAALAQQPQVDEVTDAQRDVVAERARQVAVEGWTPELDDETYGTEDLAFAASCYATADEGDAPPAVWPWHRLWWKPSDRRRNLVKAGALILAEIERHDRAAMQKDTQ